MDLATGKANSAAIDRFFATHPESQALIAIVPFVVLWMIVEFPNFRWLLSEPDDNEGKNNVSAGYDGQTR
jgi:hypothetical protein